MKVQHYREIAPLSVAGIEETTQGLTIRRVIDQVDGARDFLMDVFEIESGGWTEMHEHPWEHQVFVVSGEGEVTGPDETTIFVPGQVIFIAPDEKHQFRNTGTDPVLFVCSIPKAALTAYYLEQADDGGT
jgi:quercetin dioxygenase-like cupin family protein